MDPSQGVLAFWCRIVVEKSIDRANIVWSTTGNSIAQQECSPRSSKDLATRPMDGAPVERVLRANKDEMRIE